MNWWTKFFSDAGIPSFASSKYATIFYENRIQSNMLMDLDKDILKEMGITVVGDIIAILKHAKDVYREGSYDIYNSNVVDSLITKKIQNEVNETLPQKKKIVTNKVKKVVTKKVKVSSESEEDEEALLKLVKKKIPSQLSNNSTKVITRKLVPKSKTTIKVKPVIVESDDDSPPPSELKTKSSVFDRLGVGDVSSTTPNFDSNNSPSDSRKSSVFKRLGIKQAGEPTANATLKRTFKGSSDVYYGPSIPTEETSAFSKRIKLEETSYSSSKSVFERIGASCDREKSSPGLVSKSALMRNANSGGRPIYVNPKVLNVKKLSLLNHSHFRSSDLE
ncbi:PREDICTED: uncharacterized protein C19orf47 isoform X2 [Diuraphis noxia]|uniref:uncharacterized protein C19orf47 isoform X2 n=1 Tax=Diuraphis noxia TaxID=143948 RepID=UPI000763AEDB|nr:PREDICTED: uncharacterized protein C19orf47 isoform X2 [Diuraphis noxia]